MLRRAWLVLGAVGLVAGCAASTVPDGFRSGAPVVALPAPGTLEPATVAEFEGMLAGLAGKVVVVNIWASWCAPCRTEAPLLQRASTSFGPDVAFIGVDSKDDPKAGLAFMREFGLRYPNVFDRTGGIRDRMLLRGFPTTYVVGRDGRIRAAVVGGISEQRLAAQVEDALRS